MSLGGNGRVWWNLVQMEENTCRFGDHFYAYDYMTLGMEKLENVQVSLLYK